jgi:DNA-binding MarR family transcriptional regulator
MTATAKVRARVASRPLSKQRLRLWLRLLRATRAIEAELRERLRVQFAITLPQFDVMAALYRHDDGMTMTELSRMLIVSNGNVTGIIDRLVTDGLVDRQPAADDRRSFRVRLTPKGAIHFAAIAKAHQEWVDKMLSDFDGEEAEIIIQHLDGLPARVRNGGNRP